MDLYAVGAIAYEFIYGRPPFYRRDRAEKKALILKGKLVFTTAFSVQAQVRCCRYPQLQKDRARRPIVLACCKFGAACVAAAGIHCTRIYREVARSITIPAIAIVQPRVMLDLIFMQIEAWAKSMYAPRLQHFIQKAMHAHPSCRGTATDLLSHQWILTNTGQEITPHWAPPEPAFAHSQIPGPPAKAAADAATKPLETAARMHQYKFASGIDPDAAAVAMARGNEISRTATWDAASSARPDTKHRLDSQVSALRGGGVGAARCAGDEAAGGVAESAGAPMVSHPLAGGLVRICTHMYCVYSTASGRDGALGRLSQPRSWIVAVSHERARVAASAAAAVCGGAAQICQACGGAAQFCQVIFDRACTL